MKNKILLFFGILFLVASVAGIVEAGSGSLDVSIEKIRIKDIELTSGSNKVVSLFAGEVVPVTVLFKSST